MPLCSPKSLICIWSPIFPESGAFPEGDTHSEPSQSLTTKCRKAQCSVFKTSGHEAMLRGRNIFPSVLWGGELGSIWYLQRSFGWRSQGLREGPPSSLMVIMRRLLMRDILWGQWPPKLWLRVQYGMSTQEERPYDSSASMWVRRVEQYCPPLPAFLLSLSHLTWWTSNPREATVRFLSLDVTRVSFLQERKPRPRPRNVNQFWNSCGFCLCCCYLFKVGLQHL